MHKQNEKFNRDRNHKKNHTEILGQKKYSEWNEKKKSAIENIKNSMDQAEEGIYMS